MALIFRWLMRMTTGALVLAVAAFALLYYFAARSLPDYDTTQSVAGITAPVEIVRDNANVPHIFGATDPDVYFALGYAHAQDRMWQMTMLRRTAQGRLAELFGESTLGIDKLLRRLDLYNTAVASVEDQDPETRAALEAYADGVNAWFGKVNEGARGRGAPEMWLFNHPISPWQPADSIAIIKVMALQLSSHLEHEVLRARTSLMIGNDLLEDILPDVPGPGIASLPDYASLVPGAPRYAANSRLPFSPLSPVKPAPLAGASNAWAAGPTRSATGGTLLANDPHLGLTAPSVWYLARLELRSGGVIGGTIPGVPVILTGRSDRIGWGITSSYLDDQDVHIEELNPESRNQYRTPDGWADFETRDSIIKVKDGAAVTLKLRWTENGPVLAGDQFDLGTITPAGHVASLSWTALSPDDTTLTAAIKLMQATTIEDAFAAAESYIAPSQNLTVADRTRVGMKVIGAIPNRDPAHRSQGRLPSLGHEAVNRWNGAKPATDNPTFTDPEGDILGNTNNKTVDLPFPDHALELLAAWNGEMNEHLPEPLIYAAWVRALYARLIQDELGPLQSEFTHPNPLFIERVFRNIDGASVWCDVIQSAPVETCTDISRQALDDALIWIDETHGTTIAALRWGDAHQATHDHPVLGEVPVLRWFVNIRQSTSGGDHTLQRGRTSGQDPNPFHNVHAAGYRGVYDFADPDSSVFVTATGQSGHPLSRYYDNLGELWRRGEYVPMSLDPALARAAAVGVTRLNPPE